MPEKLTENAFLVPPAFKNVQKEWTCAACQVTTQSEATLNSHLQGMKHRIKHEELKAGKLATKKVVSTVTPNKERNCAISQVTTQSKTTCTSVHQEFIAVKQASNKHNSSSITMKLEQPNQGLKKVSSGSGINKVSSANQDPKKSSSGSGPNKFDCDICQLKLQSEATLKSHLQGSKHKSKSEQLKAREGTENDKITSSAKYSEKNNGGLNKNPSAIVEIKIKANVSNGSHTCSICNVTCTSESDMTSHLRGKRHLSEIASSRVQYWCNICDVKCYSETDMTSHLNGKTHDSNLYDSD